MSARALWASSGTLPFFRRCLLNVSCELELVTGARGLAVNGGDKTLPRGSQSTGRRRQQSRMLSSGWAARKRRVGTNEGHQRCRLCARLAPAWAPTTAPACSPVTDSVVPSASHVRPPGWALRSHVATYGSHDPSQAVRLVPAVTSPFSLIARPGRHGSPLI